MVLGVRGAGDLPVGGCGRADPVLPLGDEGEGKHHHHLRHAPQPHQVRARLPR